MPTFKHGDMFDIPDTEGYGIDAIFVTSNSYMKQCGALTMGAGAAKDMVNHYPGIDKTFGSLLAGKHLGMYSILSVPVYGQSVALLGLFQVKYHWNKPASVSLIYTSARKLADFAGMFRGTIALNFPGIGHGELAREDVLPLLDVLPHNVWVYEL